jgi:hypothetical protein
MPRPKAATVVTGDLENISKEPVFNLVESYHTTAKGRRMRDVCGVNLLDKHETVNKRAKTAHIQNDDEIQGDPGVIIEMSPTLKPSKAARRREANSERRKVGNQLFNCVYNQIKMPTQIVETWSPFQEKYLLQLFRVEAGPSAMETCSKCKEIKPLHRCMDCHSRSNLLRCSSCIVEQHCLNPLHRIEV